jgi:hypothetical protein
MAEQHSGKLPHRTFGQLFPQLQEAYSFFGALPSGLPLSSSLAHYCAVRRA